MHVNYWGIARSPFASQLNPADFFRSESHEEALARVEFLIDNGRRLGFLLGASGTGKTLLLEMAARHLRRTPCQVIRLNAVGLGSQELVWRLVTGLGHLVPTNAGPTECWRGISDRLVANRYQKVSTVFLIDDADEASSEVYPLLCRLALIDPHPEALITIVLAAQRQRMMNFGTKLNELCELRVDLNPWNAAETASYIRQALAQQGTANSIFTPAALEHLHELSHGVARRVRQLAELSLLAGAAEELPEITEHVVDSVHRSLTARGLAEAA
jgi:general secretion pathway protein A